MKCGAGVVMVLMVITITLEARPSLAQTLRLADDDCDVGQSAFDDSLHRLWYDRFWTGACDGLWFEGCWPGKSWVDLVETIRQRHGSELVSALSRRLCALGRSVGLEWARANDVRRISTDDLEVWYGDLATTENLDATLSLYEELVARLLKEQ